MKLTPENVEALSARLHEIYQAEAHRRGDIRHADAYDDLPDATKEWDRVLARWIISHWVPRFDPGDGFPSAHTDGQVSPWPGPFPPDGMNPKAYEPPAHSDGCGCPCHQVIQPGLIDCPRCGV